MAEVTGPINTLPGRRHKFPEGTMCDEHPDVPAVARIQGETDSFGCEMADMCQACVDEMERLKEEEGPHMGCCDWCKKGPLRLYPTRDYDEGSYGPVYDVCGPCGSKQLADLQEENDRYDREEEERNATAQQWDQADEPEVPVEPVVEAPRKRTVIPKPAGVWPFPGDYLK